MPREIAELTRDRGKLGFFRDDRQGKCEPCKRAFVWRGRPALQDALCPHCRAPLSRTSRYMKAYPWARTTPYERAHA
jgi:predicted amidophosphoribosyltransferase